MKNFSFSKYALVALVAYAIGMYHDTYMMANDEDYHDYWIKRAKKTE